MNLSPPIAGVLPVVQLSFHEDDAIDFATLQVEIDWLFDQGVDGITLVARMRLALGDAAGNGEESKSKKNSDGNRQT